MAKFEKGNKLSTGRPPGSKDKKTEQWNLLSSHMVNDYTKRVDEYLKGLKDKDFFDAYLNILEYFKPKQQRTEHLGKIEQPSELDNMTYEEAFYLKHGFRPEDK